MQLLLLSLGIMMKNQQSEKKVKFSDRNTILVNDRQTSLGTLAKENCYPSILSHSQFFRTCSKNDVVFTTTMSSSFGSCHKAGIYPTTPTPLPHKKFPRPWL